MVRIKEKFEKKLINSCIFIINEITSFLFTEENIYKFTCLTESDEN